MMQVIVGGTSQGDLAWEKVSIEEILALATTSSLLGDQQTYKLSGALGGDRAEEFFDIAKELVISPNQFIFFEEKLLKKATDKLAKVGAKIVVQAAPKKEEPFNVFALTYALAGRDRKKLWLLLLQALRAGVAPEAIAGILHWKVRSMVGERQAKYAPKELKHISHELVSLYHDSHRGAGELSLLLERFILLI